ncbi:MAG: hypothetical protein AAGC60_20790 [Acidobacteriota bacterium]
MSEASLRALRFCLVPLLLLSFVACDDDGEGARPDPLPAEPEGRPLTVSVTHAESVLVTGSCALDLLALPDGGTEPLTFRWDSVYLQGPWTEQSLRLTFAPGTSHEVTVRLTVSDAAGSVAKLTPRYAVSCPALGSTGAVRVAPLGSPS